MSDEHNDGGCAFPVLDDGGSGLVCRSFGMSLRDYFAAQVIGSWGESNHGVVYHARGGYPDDALQCASDLAQAAYILADAMLKAREAK